MRTPFYLLSLSLLVLAACDNNTPKPQDPPKNESELITSFILEFTDSSDNTVHYSRFSDPDGDGGNVPTQFDSIQLKANSSYFTRILLLDESKSPVDSISKQVQDEGVDHLFVFQPNGLNLSLEVTDKDKNLLPLGLQTIWRTGNNSTGSIRIVLKHQPGIKTGDPDIGESDIDLLFKVDIQ